MMKSHRGFTLIELMVAMSLLLILGLFLSQLTQYTMQVWQETEQARVKYQQLREVMGTLEQDLDALYSHVKFSSKIAFRLTQDANDHPRLVFIRKLQDELKHPILRYAGEQQQSAGYQEHYHLGRNQKHQYRATGGLAEIIYFVQPRTENRLELWRGLRTPLGGQDSFLRSQEISKLKQQSELLTDNLLHFSIQCWGPDTQQWNDGKTEPGGSYVLWDSEGQENFASRLRSFSQRAVFPGKLRIRLAFPGKNRTYLAQPLTKQDNVCYVQETEPFASVRQRNRYLLIDEEWLFYENKSTGAFQNLKRGIWGTLPQDHFPQKEVTETYYEPWDKKKLLPKKRIYLKPTLIREGIPFSRTFHLPTFRRFP